MSKTIEPTSQNANTCFKFIDKKMYELIDTINRVPTGGHPDIWLP